MQAPVVRTLMHFDGCNKALGCTVLLKGADVAQLARVKRAMRFLVLAAYHLRLECMLLAEEMTAAVAAASDDCERTGKGGGFGGAAHVVKV